MRRPNGRLVEAELLINARLGQEISGNVFAQELVVRHIGIQCADEIIAVLHGVRNARVALTAERLRVAHPIHPMPRPTLSKMRRGQQAIDGIFNCRLAIDECRLRERQ